MYTVLYVHCAGLCRRPVVGPQHQPCWKASRGNVCSHGLQVCDGHPVLEVPLVARCLQEIGVPRARERHDEAPHPQVDATVEVRGTSGILVPGGPAIRDVCVWCIVRKANQDAIDGNQMQTAIKTATEDTDGQAAGKEFHDLNDFVTNNWARMNPDARAKWAVYKGEVEKQQALGKQGISMADYEAMLKRMDAAQGPTPPAPQTTESDDGKATQNATTAAPGASSQGYDGFGVGPAGNLRKQAAQRVAAEADNPKAKDQLDALNGLSDRLAEAGGGTINGYFEQKLQAVNDASEKAIKNPDDAVLRAELNLATADLEAAGVLTLDARPEDLTAALVSEYLAIKARRLL